MGQKVNAGPQALGPPFYDGKYVKGAIGLLAVMHLAGLVGYISPVLRPYFLTLTPFNLVVTAGVLVLFHFPKTKRLWVFILAAFCMGFVAEAIGVNTGYLFGDYAYGKTLGPAWLGVPLVIGLNWVSLTYMAAVVCGSLPVPDWLKAAFGGLLLVGLDVLIEPVAMAFDFWDWEGHVIPWGNYLGWFLVAYFIIWLFYKLALDRKNPAVLPVLIIQLLFFLLLFIYLQVV